MNIEHFIEENIDLVDQYKFTELYDRCAGRDFGKLTDVLYECDIDPLQYMTEVPAWFAFESHVARITIPTGITSIGISAFSQCISLTSIAIPSSVTSIGAGAFNRCEKLNSITLPNSVTSIGDNAFNECKNLTNITIPSSVTSIGYFTFCGCKNLTSITIPSSVTSIKDGAFNDCGNLQITYAGTRSEWSDLVAGKEMFLHTTCVCNCSDGTVKKSK